MQWHDPRLWLEEALRADGRDPAEVQTLAGVRVSSRAAQAVGDLALYDEAYRILDRLVQSGRAELRERLASREHSAGGNTGAPVRGSSSPSRAPNRVRR